MIIQEINLSEPLNPPKENTYPVEPRHRHRYNEVDLNGEQFLVPKSCKNCHGTGIYCWIPEDEKKGMPRTAVKCRCIIKSEKETELDAKEA